MSKTKWETEMEEMTRKVIQELEHFINGFNKVAYLLITFLTNICVLVKII